MQTTYGHGTRAGRGKEKNTGSKRQFVQLLVCLAAFLAVFIGKGVWPSEMAQAGKYVLSVIRANADFRSAFADLGQALAQQDSVVGELGEFCVAVFAPEQISSLLPEEEGAMVEEQPAQPELPVEEAAAEPTMQVGDVVMETEGQIELLPEGYSEQWLYLGDMEFTTPVLGNLTSRFGYRDHPTIGRHAAHGGVDIAADTGTAVAAFLDGTVVSVGEDTDYGKYLYLTHENGVTTFYAHCSKVCVQEGERVKAGQTVAQVGSTGKSTGPHLHFEVRLNGVRLDPTYYIDPSGTK